MNDEIPGSVRIRTSGDNEHRYRSIMRATELYDCNRSDAVAQACNDVPAAIELIEYVLTRRDLTTKQKLEIADKANRSLRGIEIEVDTDITIKK